MRFFLVFHFPTKLPEFLSWLDTVSRLLNHLRFIRKFPGKSWLADSPSSTSTREERLRTSGMGFQWARCPSCHPTNSDEVLKETLQRCSPK